MALGSSQRPLRVAIVGAGPAGFYAIDALLKQASLHVGIDLYEQLPAPYGLVRYGVAPDHEKIKRVQQVYEDLAKDPRVRFFGNVTLGRDIHQSDLVRHYDQVMYTVGAQSDRSLGIPGEQLDGSYSATEFVAWYNAHPDFSDRSFDLSHETAVVIGVGNVAVDAARILAKSRQELAITDISDPALDALAKSKVRNVYVLGRRGPVQAKFSTPEIKEFGDLDLADPIIDPADLVLDPPSNQEMQNNRTAERNVKVLQKYAERPPGNKSRKVLFRFLVSPVEILEEKGRVAAIRIVKNKLVATESGYINAQSTGEFETIPCGLVLRSVGYRGIALPEIPFDARRGVIPNQAGRVTNNSGEIVPRQYVAGWIKRGPTGVIGSNKSDAVETVQAMLEDLSTIIPADTNQVQAQAPIQLLRSRGVRYVDFADWCRIQAEEDARGKEQGRPRVKFWRREQMFSVLDS